MPSQTVRCSHCNQETDAADRFCPRCGSSLSGAMVSGDPSAGAQGAGGAAARDRLAERVSRASVGRFDVLRLLGRGGMAAVYLAYDLRLGRKVALKVMLPQIEHAEGMSDRFVNEAKTAARLTHPNIIIVHSVEELGDLVLFVMNFVDGASLEQVAHWLPRDTTLKTGQLPIEVVQTLLVQVANALDYAHSERVVHRDVKPSNVMITLKGDAIITDFGIAKVTADAGRTKTSIVMGTPTYMSPEQCRGESVTGASDQYSFGAMAYELLAGEPPFTGLHFEVVNAHIADTPTPLTERRPDTPPHIASTVMRMLSKRASDRFASMADVAHALSEGLDTRSRAPHQMLGAAALAARDASDGSGFHTPRSPILDPALMPKAKHVSVSVEVGKSIPLPFDAVDNVTARSKPTSVDWQIRDSRTVRIAANGEITGLAEGETTVIGAVGDETITYHITVRPSPPAASGNVAQSIREADTSNEVTVPVAEGTKSAEPRAATPRPVAELREAPRQPVPAPITPRVAPPIAPPVPHPRRSTRVVAVASVLVLVAVAAIALWSKNGSQRDAPPNTTATQPAPDLRQGDSSSGALPPKTAPATTSTAQADASRDPLRVERIELLPSSPQRLRVGESVKLTARTVGNANQTIPSATVNWKSDDPSIATVNAVGVAVATKIGTTRISASSGGKTATINLTVVAAEVAAQDAQRGRGEPPVASEPVRTEPAKPIAARVQITAAPQTLQMGSTGQWKVRALTAAGAEVTDVIPQVRAEPAALLRISANGELVPLGVGRVTLIASAGTLADSSAIVITAAPAPVVQAPPVRTDSPATTPATTRTVPSIAELTTAAQPFLAALVNNNRNGVAAVFRTRDAGAKSVLDWARLSANLSYGTFTAAKFVGPAANDPFAFEVTLQWRTPIGQCRQGQLAVQARTVAGKMEIETATPPSPPSGGACRGK